jgi:hypothetical protein
MPYCKLFPLSHLSIKLYLCFGRFFEEIDLKVSWNLISDQNGSDAGVVHLDRLPGFGASSIFWDPK